MDGRGTTATTPLGILAGGSGVPLEIADAVTRRGRGVHIVALVGEADPDVARFPHTWVKWGGIGAIIEAFRSNGCREIVIVGRVRRPNLMKLRPDLGFWKSLPGLVRFLRGGDDAILRMVIGFFERHGLRVVGAHEAAPEMLAGTGPLCKRRPTDAELSAIDTASRALSALGPFDAAQAAVARAGELVVVEGADGTDAMLRRLVGSDPSAGRIRAPIRASRGGVLVKLPKPDQERRIDLPAIGPETVRRAVAAGLTGIAVRSGGTLIAERGEAMRLADEAGLFVIGVDEAAGVAERSNSEGASADARQRIEALQPFGARKAAAGPLEDAELAARVIGSLEPLWPRSSAVVSRRYVLAVEGPGGALAAAERTGRVKPWGMRLLRRQVGVLVMADLDGELGPEPALLARRAKASGLAGIAVLRSPMDERGLAALVTAADETGLFLLAPGSAM